MPKRFQKVVFVITLGLLGTAGYWWWSTRAVTPQPEHTRSQITATSPAEPESTNESVKLMSVSGIVLNAATRRGIGGTAEVLIDGVHVVTTQNDGTFTIPPMSRGSYTLTAQAPGFVGPPPSASQGTAIRIDDNKTLEGVELLLRRAASIDGVVLANGKPVAGARISLVYATSPGATEPFGLDPGVATDRSGIFRLETLFPGQFRILVEHDDYAWFESDDNFVDDGEQLTGIEIHLTGGGTASGSVRDNSGNPVDNAVVWLGGDDYARRDIKLDKNGTWKLADLVPGRFKVYATAVGYRPTEAGPFDVEPGGEAGPVTVILHESPGFGGRVLSAEGEPVAEAVVYYRPQGWDEQDRPTRQLRHETASVRLLGRTYTDENGEFWVHTPLTETVMLTATHTRHAPSDTVSVMPTGPRRTELRLAPGGSMSGVVSASDSRLPVQNYEVAIVHFQPFENSSVRGGGFGRLQVADSDGRFLFSGLTPGTYAISVMATGYIAKRVDHIDVRGGVRTGDLRITLERGGALAGMVVDANTQQPIIGAQVQANTLYDLGYRRGGPSVQTGADGRFTLEGLPAGPRSLTVGKSGYVTQITSGHNVPAVGTNEVGVLELAEETTETRGKYRYSGIGTVLKKDGDRLLISELVDTGSASVAGIVPGTEIVAVNGRPVSDLPMAEVVELIRGKEGSDVSLTVLSPDSDYAEKIDLRRETVTMRQDR